MDHLVRYRSPSGDDEVRDAATLDEALSLVERLRNEDGVSDVRIYRRLQVEFRTYYKATVVGETAPAAGTALPAATSAPSVPTEPPPGAMVIGPPLSRPAADEPTEDETVDASSGSRRTLFSRG